MISAGDRVRINVPSLHNSARGLQPGDKGTVMVPGSRILVQWDAGVMLPLVMPDDRYVRIYDLQCAECGRVTTACTCRHDPDACPALFIDDEGWLLRCEFPPGHSGNDPRWHESGDWGWESDEYGMPPLPECYGESE